MSLTAWLCSIATGDPCDEGKNEGVAEEQVSANTNTEIKDIGQNGKYTFFCNLEKSCSVCLAVCHLIS